MGAPKVQGPEDADSLGMRDFFRPIRTFWSEHGRCFELDARGQRWREVPGIGPRPAPWEGWNPLAV